MNVPTSIALRAPTASVKRVMNAPCSGAICIMAKSPTFSFVSLISACCTASGGVPWATRYSWIAGDRKNDFGIVSHVWAPYP